LQKEDDERREKVLSELGLRVVGFGNDDVANNLPETIEKLKQYLN